MSIMEMEEIKSAIAGVESKVEYNGGHRRAKRECTDECGKCG